MVPDEAHMNEIILASSANQEYNKICMYIIIRI